MERTVASRLLIAEMAPTTSESWQPKVVRCSRLDGSTGAVSKGVRGGDHGGPKGRGEIRADFDRDPLACAGGPGRGDRCQNGRRACSGAGKYFQAFPEYGPERSGAPIVAFTRVSDEPIDIHCGIEHPLIVVVLDPSLFGSVDITGGMPSDGVVLVNSDLAPADLREGHGLSGLRLFTISATRIAMETIGRPIPNTPMVGALTRITELFALEDVVTFYEKEFAKKFPPKVVEGNIRALRRSYEEVRSE